MIQKVKSLKGYTVKSKSPYTTAFPTRLRTTRLQHLILRRCTAHKQWGAALLLSVKEDTAFVF